MRKQTCYISGPYTRGDPEVNVKNAISAAEEVAKHWFIPFVPHLYHFWHKQHAHDYEFWMEQDLVWVCNCDVMLRLPGESKGADIEVAKAKECGIPVFFSTEALFLYELQQIALAARSG
jgi:hypothetical protein